MISGYLRQCTTNQAENGGQPKLGDDRPNLKMLGQGVRTSKILIYSSDIIPTTELKLFSLHERSCTSGINFDTNIACPMHLTM